jgi:hypothetical protein
MIAQQNSTSRSETRENPCFFGAFSPSIGSANDPGPLTVEHLFAIVPGAWGL